MRKKYNITIIKDKRVHKYMENLELELAIDYFKAYSSPDYYVTVSETDINRPVLFKLEGISL